MIKRTLRAIALPGQLSGSQRWPQALTVIACVCLFSSAPMAEVQAAPDEAAAVARGRAREWKVHALRGNRPLYRRSGEILVEYQKGATRGLTDRPGLAGMLRGSRTARGDVEALTFDEDAVDFAAVRAQLLATPGVRRAEPNFVFSTLETTLSATRQNAGSLAGEDYAAKQWHLDRIRGQSRALQASGARLAGEAIRIGVIDTGVDYSHSEFSGRTGPGINLISNPVPGEDPESEGDLNGHGTRVAGIIAAADDGRGVLGINPRAEIYSIKTFNRDGDGYLEDIIAGIDWAIAQQMHVINMSFGTYEHSELLEDAIARAQSAGILLVAAAGNDAAEAAMYPAAFAGVLSVGAYDEGGWTSHFSNWGSAVDFHAPGSRILTTDLWADGSDPYTAFNGTSAATAYTTGIASLLIEGGESAAAAADRLRESVTSRRSDYHVRPQGDLWLNGRLIMARLQGELYSELTIASFDTDRSIFAHEDEVPITLEVQNTGTEPSSQTETWLVVREGEAERRVPLGQVPVLQPGERHQATRVVGASELLEPGAGSPSAHRLSVEIALDSLPLAANSPRRLLVTDESLNAVRVRALWVTPLDFGDANAERTLYATVENPGRAREDGLVARVYAVAAVHEGVGKVPKMELGTIPVGSLAPGETTQLSLPLSGFEPPAQRVTFWMEIEEQGQVLARYLQGYQYAETGTASPEYAQDVHRAIADEAVALLEAQGIFIEDLHAPGSIYRGAPAAFNTWPETAGLPTAEWSDPDFWTDADLAAGAATFGLNSFTLVDGAHDADGIDIAFGYTFEDNFDSHFWIVDNFDDDGLDSLGTNHHSALSKLRALFFGTGTGPLADSQLAYGAFDHYAAGHKQAAWWFVGHAVHLIGDISVPSHVDNENLHGVTGATYHGWMDKGRYTRWDASDALSRGGFVDPFDPASLGDPIRYLAYTTAQLGNAFPWAETVGTQGGADGNRTAGGDPPFYGATMQSLFATLEPRPLVKRDVNKDEVEILGFCEFVDLALVERSDCNGDGHVDHDNTDNGGSNDDGDMVRIGTENYPYAIRAAAGLIYYFAIQSGQLPEIVTNTNDDGAGSLRAAIAVSPPGNWIRFDPALSGQTISLTTGEIDVAKDLVIDASDLPGGLTITGNDLSRVLAITDGTTVSMKGLTITEGLSDLGGGIRNNGTLTLIDSTVSGSQATVQGGAIYNDAGNLSLEGVTLSGNTADSSGGAIWSAGGTTLVENSTIDGNQAQNHAGIGNDNGSLTVVHSTIAQNQALAIGSRGGGISHLESGLATTQIENSIVALNSADTGADVFKDGGSVSPSGANLIGDNDTVGTEFPPGPLVGTTANPKDPMLGDLGDHDGPTSTRLPLPQSPAIDAAIVTASSPASDQRGVQRPQGASDDLGAVELATVTAVDFSDGGASLQPGFEAQGTADAAYSIDASGNSALMIVDLPTTTSPISTRASNPVASSDSRFVSDGTDIGPLSADHFVHVAADARIEISLSGLAAGTHIFEGWWSDVDQAPGLLFQRLEVSTDAGSSFSTVSSAIDPAGLNAAPVSFAFTADGIQDVLIRVTENNASDELRLNAIAVPEPGILWQALSALVLLGVLRRRQNGS